MKTLREIYERNVLDVGLLGEFPSDCRVPHTDKDGKPLKAGDEVVMQYLPKMRTSFLNTAAKTGERFIVLKCGVSGGRCYFDGGYHLLQMKDGITAAPVEMVKLVEE